MDSPIVIQPSWALFLIKYTDVMITVALVYFAIFFSLVAASIVFPALRTKHLTLPWFRSGRIASPATMNDTLRASPLKPASA